MLFEKQQFQEDCVSNIIKVLDQTDIHHNDFSNLPKVISQLNAEQNTTQFITSNSNKIDILMETGTGKTFTYLKTIFEINKQYGKNKFIITVPRNAIKLGVIQNINLTKEYFFNEYKKHLNIIEFPKDGISKIEHEFLNNNSKITVLILTNSAFNKADNTINKMPENGTLFQNGTIWDNIAKQNPIIIIDEPHLLKGTETQKSFDKLNSLFIRFGATYPNDKKLSDNIKLSNVAYALDSITSFNQYLVKKISVNTLLFDAETGNYILSKIEAKKKQFTLTYFQNHECYSIDIGLGQDIGIKTNIEALKGVYATKVTADTVYLSNKTELTLNTAFSLSDDETRLMIRETIKKHFEKEYFLFQKKIKTLSLFFIPNILDFRGDNPIIKNIFEEEYRLIRDQIYQATTDKDYKAYLDQDFIDGQLAVHEGYFSGDKGTKDDQISKGIDQILNKKEELLSVKTPLRFIFSVWALQEGWDNPNIFNICKIASTNQDISRRQQVGRGLRLAVNQAGKRQTFHYLDEKEHDFYEINTLNIFVSHYELDFIKNIQKEIEQASFCIVGDVLDTQMLKDKGLTEREASRLLNTLEDEKVISFLEATDNYQINQSIYEFINQHTDKLSFLDKTRLEIVKDIFKEVKLPVENGNKKPTKVKIRHDKFKEFKILWETINRKSKLIYQDIQKGDLITSIAERFNQEKIDPIEIKIIEQTYHSHKNQIENKQETILSNKVNFFANTQYQDFITSFTQDKKLKLPLIFITQLLSKLDIEKIKNNPKKAKERLREIIIDNINDSVIQKIDYAFENEIKITALHDSKKPKQYLTEINHTLIGKHIANDTPKDESLFDKVVYDSQIEKDIQTLDPMQIDKQKITVFAKLPKISIPTPYKNYSPDFAYLIDRGNDKKLFLIVESKGYKSELDIPKEEQNKIKYAKVFFEKLQQEMPNIKISYKTRINGEQLSQILTDVAHGKVA